MSGVHTVAAAEMTRARALNAAANETRSRSPGKRGSSFTLGRVNTRRRAVSTLYGILWFLLWCGEAAADPPAPPPPPATHWQYLVTEANADSILQANAVPSDRPFVVFVKNFGEFWIIKSFGHFAGKGEDIHPAEPAFHLADGTLLPLDEARPDTLYEAGEGYYYRAVADEHGNLDRRTYLLRAPTVRGFFIAPEDWSLGICSLGDYRTEGQALAEKLYTPIGLAAVSEGSRVRYFSREITGMKEGRKVHFVAFRGVERDPRGDEREVAGRIVYTAGDSFSVEQGALVCEP